MPRQCGSVPRAGFDAPTGFRVPAASNILARLPSVLSNPMEALLARKRLEKFAE